MEITSAEFITSMNAYQAPREAMPQISVVGRSNVGKSSLINLFLLNKNFYLVDLPGYGFAKVDKQEKLRWGQMMDGYFEKAEDLRLTLHLVDIRHEPTQDDIQMNMYLRAKGIPFMVVCTKSDKISRGARMKHLAPICGALQVQPWQVLCFSSENGHGRDQLLALLEDVLTENEETEAAAEDAVETEE